jgi:hypothetical protein
MAKTYRELLEELRTDTFICLKPSGIHGIGVFALRDIQINVNPFAEGVDDWISITDEDVASLPNEIKGYIYTHSIHSDDGYSISTKGF